MPTLFASEKQKEICLSALKNASRGLSLTKEERGVLLGLVPNIESVECSKVYNSRFLPSVNDENYRAFEVSQEFLSFFPNEYSVLRAIFRGELSSESTWKECEEMGDLYKWVFECKSIKKEFWIERKYHDSLGKLVKE